MKVCVSLATCPCSHIWASQPCILCQLQLFPYLLYSLPAAIVACGCVGVGGRWQDMQWAGGGNSHSVYVCVVCCLGIACCYSLNDSMTWLVGPQCERVKSCVSNNTQPGETCSIPPIPVATVLWVSCPIVRIILYTAQYNHSCNYMR